MQTVDEKTIILIGPKKSGKRHFVKSLEFLGHMTFGTPVSSRKPFFNLKGNESDQEFEVLLPSDSMCYDAIKLKIIICRSIKFDGDMKENLESIRCLKDYNYDFNSIFFFSNGPRILSNSKMCLENLFSIYGESLVEYITIIQSFSSKINEEQCLYVRCTDSNDLKTKDLKDQKKYIENFYNDGVKEKRSQFYDMLKQITSKINERFPCENFSKFQEIALNKVAYIEFGELKLREIRNKKNKEKNEENKNEENENNEKNKEDKKECELVSSSIPPYPQKFLEDYKSKFAENPEDRKWVDRFLEKIFSMKDTFSFKKIDEEIIEIERLTKEKRENLEIDKIAFEKAVNSICKSEKSNWFKSLIRNISIGAPVALKKFNPFNNFSLLNSLGEDNGAEIMETLRTLNESRHLSSEADYFNKLMEEFKRYKDIEKIKRMYNIND